MSNFITEALTAHLRGRRDASPTLSQQTNTEAAEQLATSITAGAPPESCRRLLFTEVRRMESNVRRLRASDFQFDKSHAERLAHTAAQLRRIASASE
jgi:hypothetical protein